MKFGKGLLHEILQSNPEWAPFWLNYKALKKRIKAVTRAAHHAANQRDISESKLEVAFFRDLQTELKKISLFYAAEEKRCSFRYQQLQSVLQTLKRKENIDAFEAQRLMYASVHFYRECIRLENFAVINYQGFSKILKKHDKITGYNTRSKYMRRKVNLLSFSSYPNLLQILSSTEKMFHEVERDTSMVMSSMKYNMKSKGINTENGRVPIPMVHLWAGTSRSSTPIASSLASNCSSPHVTRSNISTNGASFSGSMLEKTRDSQDLDNV
ncbi:unnamed protein product [Peronospora belbahrii]|uniref:SPX domain-containing protein n=1 Tax=Peronospora belbahrii TaxID=622444 RepID=A0AAU9KXK7_9STRA|nr:unnamed protein product [Peronospora belbahrii]CAH0517989.1 unnamed protein product [Peronospora belbahrii]